VRAHTSTSSGARRIERQLPPRESPRTRGRNVNSNRRLPAREPTGWIPLRPGYRRTQNLRKHRDIDNFHARNRIDRSDATRSEAKRSVRTFDRVRFIAADASDSGVLERCLAPRDRESNDSSADAFSTSRSRGPRARARRSHREDGNRAREACNFPGDKRQGSSKLERHERASACYRS